MPSRDQRERLIVVLTQTLTEAVIRSLQDQLRAKPRPIDWDKVDAISREIAALPVLDSRTADEILGYDEFGIPR
jgi:antitoxin VapB